MPSDITTNELIVVGLNHKTAPLHVREQLAFDPSAKESVTLSLNERMKSGAVVLSTCNRVEFYGFGIGQNLELERDIVALIAERCTVSQAELSEYLYTHHGEKALHHLFRVASSLDSLVVGEPQILGQLKEAFEESQALETSGALTPFMERAFMVARRVRSQTGISKYVVSISSVAVKLARHIFEDLSQKTTLLIGAGEMGELAARHLCQEGVGKLLVANRSLERATILAESLGGSPRALTELPELLARTDIVITSTGSREPIITLELAQAVLKARKYRPLFVIDIAVPRDVDPAVNRLENIYVYDIDDLSQIADQNHAQRQVEAQEAETMVNAELAKFYKECAQKSLGPMIVSVRRQVHELKEQELAWAISKLARSSTNHEQVLKQFGERFANKVLHQLIKGMKGFADDPRRDEALSIIAELLALDTEVSLSSSSPSPLSED
jgi:glutamyl-tRNA reductase